MFLYEGYYVGLMIAWTCRAVLAISLISISMGLGGCGHSFNMSGSIAKDPQSTTGN